MSQLQQTREEILKSFVEHGANLEHARWARWQKHLHSRMIRIGDGMHSGKLAMDIGDESRWERQIRTPFTDLSELEKESDRREVRTYLPLIEKLLSSYTQAIVEEIKNLMPEKIADHYPEDFLVGFTAFKVRIKEKLLDNK